MTMTNWNKTSYYTYDGNQITSIKTEAMMIGTKYNTSVKLSYRGNQLERMEAVDGAGSFTNEELIYSFDGSNRLTGCKHSLWGKGEEGYKLEYKYAGTPKKAESTNGIKIYRITPASGKQGEYFPTTIEITFTGGYDIRDIHNPEYGIAIVDAENDEIVYAWGYNNPYNSHTANSSGSISYKGSTMTWYIPHAKTENSPFKKGHTYYLRIYSDLIDFEGTDKKFESSGFWQYTLDSEEVYQFNFTSSGSPAKTMSSYCYYTDKYFEENGYSYNSRLATASLCMAMSAYNDLRASTGYKNVEDFMGKLGFENIWHNSDYESPTRTDSTGVAFGSKKLDDGTTLVVVAVRGGHYNNEWGGNFVVDAQGDHRGFEIGKNNVKNAITEYFNEQAGKNVTGHIKIWIMGYSRGSAIANLTAATLDEGMSIRSDITYQPEDVYAYCFEVPNCTVDDNAHAGLYNNIYCIINPLDIVPRIPLSSWGFTHYGNELYLPIIGSDNYYSVYFNQVKQTFKSFYPDITTLISPNQMRAIRILTYSIGKKVDRAKYNSKFQENLVSKWDDATDDTVWKLWDEVISLFFVTNFYDVDNEVARFSGFSKKETGSPFELLLYSHYSEYTLAWMRAMENTGFLENDLSEEQYYRYLGQKASKVMRGLSTIVSFHCPVNVSVISNTGITLASIKKGEIYINEDDIYVGAEYLDDGTMKFYIPEDEEVSFSIEPYNDGNMSVEVVEYNIIEDRYGYTVTYPNIEVKKGRELTMDLETTGSESSFHVELGIDGYTYIPELEKYYDEEREDYFISVQIEGDGFVCGDSSMYSYGFATLQAYGANEDEFVGWYDSEGNQLSTSSEYTFMVTQDMELTARFAKAKKISIAIPVIAAGIAVAAAAAVLILKKKNKK